jgi:hypothetical protein
MLEHRGVSGSVEFAPLVIDEQRETVVAIGH